MVGAHRGLAKDASVQPPYRTRYPPEEVVGGEGGQGHPRALQINPGFISESRNRRSAKGSTLRRWIAATTPTTVRPSSRNFYKACRIGWSFS
jgi:hypothetical protein